MVFDDNVRLFAHLILYLAPDVVLLQNSISTNCLQKVITTPKGIVLKQKQQIAKPVLAESCVKRLMSTTFHRFKSNLRYRLDQATSPLVCVHDSQAHRSRHGTNHNKIDFQIYVPAYCVTMYYVV